MSHRGSDVLKWRTIFSAVIDFERGFERSFQVVVRLIVFFILIDRGQAILWFLSFNFGLKLAYLIAHDVKEFITFWLFFVLFFHYPIEAVREFEMQLWTLFWLILQVIFFELRDVDRRWEQSVMWLLHLRTHCLWKLEFRIEFIGEVRKLLAWWCCAHDLVSWTIYLVVNLLSISINLTSNHQSAGNENC